MFPIHRSDCRLLFWLAYQSQHFVLLFNTLGKFQHGITFGCHILFVYIKIKIYVCVHVYVCVCVCVNCVECK